MTTTPTSGAADLRTAAQAVVDRWDTPLWKDVPATAEYIGRLRAALAAGQATAAPQGAAYAALPENKKKDPTMSFHNKPNYQIPELIEALKAHRLPHDTPSQLADSFRIGWMACCRELAQADSVLEDAALWHWLAEYLVGTRTDLDDEIVASETVNDLRKLVKAAIKQGGV